MLRLSLPQNVKLSRSILDLERYFRLGAYSVFQLHGREKPGVPAWKAETCPRVHWPEFDGHYKIELQLKPRSRQGMPSRPVESQRGLDSMAPAGGLDHLGDLRNIYG